MTGTYCPQGMQRGVMSELDGSPKPCAEGYYCPPASAVPTQKQCPPHTNSNILLRPQFEMFD